MNDSIDSERTDKKTGSAQTQRRSTLLLVICFVIVLAAALIFIVLRNGKHSGAPKAAETAASTETSQIETAPEASEDTEAPLPSDPAQTESAEATSVIPDSGETEASVPAADESWKLILVNADHPLPENYEVHLKELRYGHRVDERIYPELQQMFDDARAAGIYPLINESFRTRERQQEIMDKYIAGYEAQGMSHEEATQKAREIVALPGTSEHELGLALDIIAEYDADSTATWEWLRGNCWKYGFILRYPADKEDITGISYEPWHFRYVGSPAAKEITDSGLCLEEYVLNQDG